MMNLENLKRIWDKHLINIVLVLEKDARVFYKGEFFNNKPVYRYTDKNLKAVDYFYAEDRWYGISADDNYNGFKKFSLRRSVNQRKFNHPFLPPGDCPLFCMTLYNQKVLELLQYYRYNNRLTEKGKNTLVNLHLCNLKSGLPYLPKEIIDIILSYIMIIEINH